MDMFLDSVCKDCSHSDVSDEGLPLCHDSDREAEEQYPVLVRDGGGCASGLSADDHVQWARRMRKVTLVSPEFCGAALWECQHDAAEIDSARE